jgi:calcium-dependent protein kinase
MYILLSGKPPFNGKDDNEIFDKILIGNYDIKSPPFNQLSSNCLDLIKNLLNKNIEERFSAEQALNHVWFQDFKSKELYNRITDHDAIKTLFKNLKNYKRTSIIQETALAYLVHQFPRIKDVVNACKLFNQIDKSGDGKISKEELYNGLVGRYKTETLETDVDAIFKNLDMDNNGYIEYEEFVRASVSKEFFLSEKVLKFAFRYFDKDNSGEIDFNEIEEVFKQSITDKNKVHESLKKIINEVDQNGDNKIDFNEFVSIMKKMIKKK